MNEQDYIPYAAASTVGLAPSLVLAPHPDDEALGCAGAILSHVAAGDPVEVVIVTDGRRGIVDPEMSEAAIRCLRMDESICAASVLGYGQPRFWNYPDRGLVCDEHLVDRIHSLITGANYRSLFAPSLLEIHPDHRNLANACLAVAARVEQPFQLCFYEVGQPLYPNLLLDISSHIETKRRAIGCFRSQLDSQNYHLQCDGLNRFRTYTLPKTVTHAEAYSIVDSDQARRAVDLLRRTGMLVLGRKDLDEMQHRIDMRLSRRELEIQQMESQLGIITRSRSWAMTSPLRRLNRWLSRRRNAGDGNA